MTAINDLAEVAGSMKYAGGIVPLDLAMAGIKVPISLLYESLPRSMIDLKSDALLTINIAQASGRDIQADQAPLVDIYSMLDEVMRTVSAIQERTASVPDICAHYAYPAALAQPPVPSSMPIESLPVRAEEITPLPYRAPPADAGSEARQKAADKEKPGYALEQDIGNSNLIIKQLRDDSALLAWNIGEIERMVDEAIRLSYGSSVSNVAYQEPYRALGIDAERASAMQPMPQGQDLGVDVEKTHTIQPLSPGRDITAEVRKYPAIPDASDKTPVYASVVRSLADGIGLQNMVTRSARDIIVLQAAMARDVSGSMAIGVPQESRFTEARYLSSEASGSFKAASSAGEPDSAAPRVASTISGDTVALTPMSRAMDVSNIFNGLVRSYLMARGTATGTHATKEGITQLLLSLPEPQMAESPVPELFSVAARLQDARPAVTEATVAGDSSSLLGDLRDLRGTMASLQAAVDSLRLPVASATGAPETAGIIEILSAPSLTNNVADNIPIADRPDQEWVSGELLSVQDSIARLQSAYNYLRVNVPTLADFVVLQKFIQGVPAVQAADMPPAVVPAGITIEGVQPKSAPVNLMDYSWVTREFGRVQGMIARIQVPMFAEGGLVEQPTLAFVGENEPELIIPQSAVVESQSAQTTFLGEVWTAIQSLGTAMEDTVSGMNDALASVQASVSSASSSSASSSGDDSDDGTDYNVDYMGQTKDVVGRFFDPYLKQFHLNMSDLQGSFTSMSKAGFITAGTGIATLYGTDKVKDLILGGEEEEDKSDDGGGDKEAEDSGDSDEDDFWDLIEGLGDAASISDKRNYKIEDSDD